MAIKNKKQQGFSLMELLIIVAILGILVAIAIPGYNAYMEKTRRIDAISFLQEVAGEQVRFFSDNNEYAKSMDELGYGTGATVVSPEGHYTVSVANAVPTSFTLTAAPVDTSPQADDKLCASFTLDSTGLKGISGTSDVDACW